MIAGSILRILRFPLRILKTLTAVAALIKNMRLMALAVDESVWTMSVSHRISREPPPTPSPARNPSTKPMKTEKRGVSIDYAPHPISAKVPMPGEAISPGFFFPEILQAALLVTPQRDTASRHSREGFPIRGKYKGKSGILAE